MLTQGASTDTWAWRIFWIRELYGVEILCPSTLVPPTPIIDFGVKAVVISKVLCPCGEYCLVILMIELPDFDLLAVRGPQSFAGID